MQDHDFTTSPASNKPERITGTILLSYYDPDFRLRVTSEERHIVYARRFPYDDGLHDFEAANYDSQRDALLRMLSCGKPCEMTFRVEADQVGSDTSSLYFAKIYNDHQTSFADVYLGDPNLPETHADGLDLSNPILAQKVFNLLYGGFIAAEIDRMDNALAHKDRMGEVFFFRRALKHVRDPDGLLSVVTSLSRRPLTTQIQSAQDRCSSGTTPTGEKGRSQTNERG